MYHKLAFILVVVSLGLSSLYANPNDEQNVLRNRLTRLLLQNGQTADAAPYLNYQRQLSAVTKPSYATLQPLFSGLAVYNAAFEKARSQEERAELADMLAKPAWAGWDKSRKIGMLEIFDRYFPQENKDEQIALLEYHIKSNLLSKEIQYSVALFEEMNDEFVAAFKGPYHEFIQMMRDAVDYDSKKIIEAMTSALYAYENLAEEAPDSALFIKRAVFEKPFAAGWGRTTTIKALCYQIGLWQKGETYSPEQLQKQYGVSATSAKVLVRFIKDENAEN